MLVKVSGKGMAQLRSCSELGLLASLVNAMRLPLAKGAIHYPSILVCDIKQAFKSSC